MTAITTSAWSSSISVFPGPYLFTATPGAGGSLRVQWSTDNSTWKEFGDSPYTKTSTGAVPQGAAYIRAIAIGAAGTVVATYSPIQGQGGLSLFQAGQLTAAYAGSFSLSRGNLGIVQNAPSGDPFPLWQANTAYTAGQRVLPLAYQTPSTFSSGFISAGGRLYFLVCVTAGTSGTAEPSWKDPATLSNYSFNNSGTGAGQLDIVDGGVTWRARPICFIDPTYAGGSNNGSQVKPYVDWTQVQATTGAGTWGTISLDINGVTNASTTAFWAGAAFLQRVNTTYTSATVPALVVRGPSGDGVTPDNQGNYWTIGNASTAALKEVTTTWGAYRVPGDNPGRAFIVGNGATSTAAQGCVAPTSDRAWMTFQDWDISNNTLGDLQHGLLLYFVPISSGDRNEWVSFYRCNFHDCLGGYGAAVNTLNGTSTSAPINGVQFYDCNFYNNQDHGLGIGGLWGINQLSLITYSILVQRCRAWNNGKASAPQAYHHGFSTIAVRQAYGDGYTTGLAGWALVGGTTYSRGSLTPPAGTLSSVTDVPAVIYRSNGGVFPAQLQRNYATPTTPSAGQFGYNSGTLYINLGAALDVRTQVSVCFGKCFGILYQNCESFSNPTWTNGAEGHGFVSDEFSSAAFQNCWSHHNGQAGVLMNYSNGSIWSGGALTDNVACGAYTSVGVGNIIMDAIIARNPIGVQSIYGSYNTLVQGNTFSSANYGVVTYDNPASPPLAYPANTFPYTSTLAGGGNVFSSTVQVGYAKYDLSTYFNPLAQMSGDITIA